MNGIAITTTDVGFTLNIPWRIWLEKLVGLLSFGRRKELTEEEALEIIREGEREHREGRTVLFDSIDDLLAKTK
jgi:hypothetical protein